MAKTQETVQKMFSTAVLACLDQIQAAGLKTFGERKTQKGGESMDFYRYRGGKAKDGVPSMFGQTEQEDGPDFKKYTATIEVVSAQDKISWEQMQKTNLNLKDPTVKALTNAVLLKEDEKIITKITAADTKLNKAGSAELDPAALDCARAFLAEIRDCYVSAELTPDGKKGVALVMNREDYKRFSTSDAFIHGDYKDAITGGDGVLPLSMKGAEIFISPLVESGTAYIIPSNSFGYAEWEGSVDTTAEFHKTDAMRWHLQIVKSTGSVVIEPNFITKFSMKPATSTRPEFSMLSAETSETAKAGKSLASKH